MTTSPRWGDAGRGAAREARGRVRAAGRARAWERRAAPRGRAEGAPGTSTSRAVRMDRPTAVVCY